MKKVVADEKKAASVLYLVLLLFRNFLLRRMRDAAPEAPRSCSPPSPRTPAESPHDAALAALLADARGDGRSFLAAAIDFAARHTDFVASADAAEHLTTLLRDARLDHGIEEKGADADEGEERGEHSLLNVDDDDSMTSAGSVPPTPALYDSTTVEEIIEEKEDVAAAADAKQKNKAAAAVKEEKEEAATRGDLEIDDGDAAKKNKANLKPNAGNGLDLDTYSWTQTLAEVVICVPLPKGTRAKDCEVKISRDSLKVAVRGLGGADAAAAASSSSFTSVLEGPLDAAVKAEDSFWNILDGQTLEITLTKIDKMRWWSRVVAVKGTPQIDTSAVEPENSKLGDLDSETRATVEKMMWDQRQKALGLPTSEEARRAEILEKFKAQHPELDFSNAKIG